MPDFRHYNDKFRHLQKQDVDESSAMQEQAKHTIKWDIAVARWSQEEIHNAVYHSRSAEEWQRFRVSLKGQSTRMKLVRLKILLVDAITSPNVEEQTLVRCRVDNYLGALVRGGQLSPNYEVIK